MRLDNGYVCATIVRKDHAELKDLVKIYFVVGVEVAASCKA